VIRQLDTSAFEDLFAQVLVLCAQAGMVRAATVAIDGTKIAANASDGANGSEDWLRAQADLVSTDTNLAEAYETFTELETACAVSLCVSDDH
jgi:hypothetical protein